MAFLAPAIPFIMAATAVAGTVMTYRGQKKAQEAQEDAARRQEEAAREANKLAEENARMAELEAENEAMQLASAQAEEASRRRAIAAASGVSGESIDSWLKTQEDLEAANLDYLRTSGESRASALRQEGLVALASGNAQAVGTKARADLTGARATGSILKGVNQAGAAYKAGKDWWDQSDYSMGTPSPSGPYDGSAGYQLGNM